MFSGFSNQVNSWMGAVKGEPHDEEVPTPTAQQTADAEAAAAAATAANAASVSAGTTDSTAQPLADAEIGGDGAAPQAQR